MSWFESVSPPSPPSDSAKPMFDTAAMAQLGAMSPLWMLFIGASTAGMAYWSMTRWMRLAAPERIAQNVVTLRLVKSGPVLKPDPVADLEVVEPGPTLTEPAPEPVLVEPVVAEATAGSMVIPAPVAAVPDIVEVAPASKTPRVARPRGLKSVAPEIAAREPAPAKIPAKRGRPPKIKAETPASEAPLKVEPPVAPAVAKVKTPGAKRGPKPKV